MALITTEFSLYFALILRQSQRENLQFHDPMLSQYHVVNLHVWLIEHLRLIRRLKRRQFCYFD